MTRSSWFLGVLTACVVVVVPTRAQALEVSLGASVGALQVGTEPRLAASPFAGLLWHTDGGFLLAAHDMFSLVLGSHLGLHNQASATLGYTWESGDVSLGPSLSVYWMMACDPQACRRVSGAAPGVHTQVDWYLSRLFGASLSANVAWYGGSSSVLPDNPAVMVTGGLFVRLETR